MKLLIYSDLHLEFERGENRFHPPEHLSFDAVILAGDISSGHSGIEWAARTFKGKPVIYVAGNHEHHGKNIHDHKGRMEKAARASGNVTLLENKSVTIGGVRFIGSTLWTDFKLFGDCPIKTNEAMAHAHVSMEDFRSIQFRLMEPMRPSESSKLFHESSSFIESEMSKPFIGKTVVVSHHLPTPASVMPKFRDSLLSAAFASNLDHLVGMADLWVHGHAHDSMDHSIGKCRVVCNPRGYPEGSTVKHENIHFKKDLIIEI